MGSIADEHVHMIGRNFSGEISNSFSAAICRSSGHHLPRQHPLAVFRAPHKMNLEVVLRVAA
jgi:hypothetical protein